MTLAKRPALPDVRPAAREMDDRTHDDAIKSKLRSAVRDLGFGGLPEGSAAVLLARDPSHARWAARRLHRRRQASAGTKHPTRRTRLPFRGAGHESCATPRDQEVPDSRSFGGLRLSDRASRHGGRRPSSPIGGAEVSVLPAVASYTRFPLLIRDQRRGYPLLVRDPSKS